MNAKKRFGQNFLKDMNIAANIVAAAEIREGDNVWEIGPGRGVLTDLILEHKCHLTCFEIDRDLIPHLTAKYGKKINLVNRDILRIDWEETLKQTASSTGSRTVLVANIPYNITSPILDKLCRNAHCFRTVVMMMQKEVAERIASPPGNKSYGVLSLKIQYYFNIHNLFPVPATVFSPQPKVSSAVVRMTPRTRPDIEEQPTRAYDLARFWKIVETCFSARRKTLKNNLKALLDTTSLDKLEHLLATNYGFISFSLSSRAETLSEEDYFMLYAAILALNGGSTENNSLS